MEPTTEDLAQKMNGVEIDNEDIVNPWEVSSSSPTGVDYDKLISKCCNITFEEILFTRFQI